MATRVIDACEQPSSLRFVYQEQDGIREKIEAVAQKIYGADRVDYLPAAQKSILAAEQLGYAGLPVCIAKTQYSLSDDPTLLCRPHGFRVTVRDIKICSGAGFIVVYLGNILTMPGLPKHPAAEKIDVDDTGKISGLF